MGLGVWAGVCGLLGMWAVTVHEKFRSSEKTHSLGILRKKPITAKHSVCGKADVVVQLSIPSFNQGRTTLRK